ncbi:MAG: SDR family oxidoreductase [Melioribacteraceae bacterium]|nr:SDR family oxidoreductase [Melioribacteraceae bacterium]
MSKKDVAVVTGASRGIGKAIALKLAREGMDVVIFGRDSDKLTEVRKLLLEYNTGDMIFSGDLFDEDFVNSSVKSILHKYGRIDHLINNAGAAVFKKFSEISLEEFQSQVNVNVYGVFNMCKAVSERMIELKSGSIINISSLAGKNGFVNGTTYSATKHAVQGFTKSLMLELREFNIRVISICPGSVSTEMISGTPIEPDDHEKILKPEDIAETVHHVLRLPLRACVSELEIRPTNPK